ncbi:MAG: class 1 fructose-bisphosphatase [Epsilonproteobacteria bacterium]|nr:class 1 fructose-bisphosphatase [Campylobacterota bacterium]
MIEIIEAVEKIAVRIKEAFIEEDILYSDTKNATGDVQLKLDIKSDLIVEEELSKVFTIKEIISEEKEHTFSINPNGKYTIAYDPLDGSSLADVNLSVGSIFGIYEGGVSGKDLKAAIYVVYGPRVEMVVARENVEMYKLRLNNKFKFLKQIKLNNKGKLNAPGSTQKCWYPYHKEMIDDFFAKGYRLRYSGGMVPDLHHILLKGGGIFSYPGTTDKPQGKLRMLFEVFPFAFIYEKAGGEAIDGVNRLLDLKPTHIHDTTPCFFGSKEEIAVVKEVYKKAQKSE